VLGVCWRYNDFSFLSLFSLTFCLREKQGKRTRWEPAGYLVRN
jgi:hypothetical protein